MLNRRCLGGIAVLWSLAGCAAEVDVPTGPPPLTGILSVPDDSWHLLPSGCGPHPDDLPILPEFAQEIPTDRPWLELEIEDEIAAVAPSRYAYARLHNMGANPLWISTSSGRTLRFQLQIYPRQGDPIANGLGLIRISRTNYGIDRALFVPPGESGEGTYDISWLNLAPGEYIAQASVGVSPAFLDRAGFESRVKITDSGRLIHNPSIEHPNSVVSEFVIFQVTEQRD